MINLSFLIFLRLSVTQVLVVVVLVVEGPGGHDDGGRHDPDEDRGAEHLPPGPSLDK